MKEKIVKGWYMTLLVIALIGVIVWLVAFIGYLRECWDIKALDISRYGLYAVGVALIGASVPVVIWWLSTIRRFKENLPPQQ